MARQVANVDARLEYKQRLYFGFVISPLRLLCDHCGKVVLSDMEWKCASCDHSNRNTKIYSFLNRCKECGKEPKAYACPHCEKVNFLDEDSDASLLARQLPKPPPPPPPPPPVLPARPAPVEIVYRNPPIDPTAALRRARIAEKEKLNHDIEIMRLNLELVRLMNSPEFKDEKSITEQLEGDFAENKARALGAMLIGKKEKAKNAEQFRDDPDMCAMADEWVDSWVQSKT